jgi:catechol 2,3-dioxygenase-like lactoylglutathione lyase family enzyme
MGVDSVGPGKQDSGPNPMDATGSRSPMAARKPFFLHGIDHVVLRTANVNRLVRFYCQVLGCTIERRVAKLSLVQLRAGRSLIDICDVAGKLGRMGGAPPDREGHNMDHVCLRIEPFAARPLLGYLKSKGVKPGKIEKRNGAEGRGFSVYIKDPDGNSVELKGPPAR